MLGRWEAVVMEGLLLRKLGIKIKNKEGDVLWLQLTL